MDTTGWGHRVKDDAQEEWMTGRRVTAALAGPESVCVCPCTWAHVQGHGDPALCAGQQPVMNSGASLRRPKIPTKCTEILSVPFVLHT